MFKKILLMSLAIVFIGAASFSAYAQSEREDAEIRESRIKLPREIKVGKKVRVDVTVKNVGTTTWKGKGKYYLNMFAHRCPAGNSCQRDELTPYTVLEDDVAPRESYTFTFYIEGPEYTGEYQIRYKMMFGKEAFGDIVYMPIRVIR